MADSAPMEVEQTQPVEEKKGKAKASGKRFEIKKWNAVAMWSWAICTDTCAICRNNLYEPSIEYQANPTGDADHPGLSIAWGTCGHVFHLDCIQRWLKTRSACPLCNREWEFSKIERIVGGSANAEAAGCLRPRKHHRLASDLNMDLDVVRLQAELRELEGQRREVNERLRQTGPSRGPPPRGPPGPGPRDRLHHPHDVASLHRGLHDYRDEGPPPARRSGLSSVVAPVEGSEGGDRGGDRSSERYGYSDDRSEGGRSEGSRKRPAPGGALLEENADAKRRNKRLFGAILGTLQRFSKEEQALRATEAAQRRAELERRAAEKKAEEARQLRQAARDEARHMREGEIARKRQISAQAACKRLEILYATRLARADKLCSRFLLTKTPAPVYWSPAKPSKETEALAEAQREEHVAWKAAQLEQMEREKEQLMAQLTAPRRRAGEGGEGSYGGEGGSGEQPMEGDEDEQEEGEEEAMEAEAANGDAAVEQQQQQQVGADEEGEGGALEEQLQPPVLEGEEEATAGAAAATDV